MIGDLLNVVAQSVDQYLGMQMDYLTGEKRVILTHVDQWGVKNNTTSSGQVYFGLINLEQELSIRTAAMQQSVVDGGVERAKPPVHLNLQVMFAVQSTATSYQNDLNTISNIIAFFQNKPIFNQANTPELSLVKPPIEQVSFELMTLPLEQQFHLWSMLGCNYLPSAIYKMKMLTIQEKEFSPAGGGIECITMEVGRG